MKTFHLPDLGEGLPEAEIIEWFVAEGDSITADQPMVSVETAKAIVEIPAPQTGIVANIYAKAGEIIATGAPLMAFSEKATSQSPTTEPPTKHPSDSHKTATHTPPPQTASASHKQPAEDQGTVVGKIPEQSENLEDYFQQQSAQASNHQTLTAMPAARALATAMGIDLSTIQGTGPNGTIVLEDVKARLNLNGGGDGGGTQFQGSTHQSATTSTVTIEPSSPIQSSAGKTALPALSDHVGSQRTFTLRGTRRAMAHAMAKAHSDVVKVTIVEDAQIHRWREREDPTLRLIRAIAYAASVEPGLNAWYDHSSLSVTQFDDVHLGMAVDTPDGLFVPVLPFVDSKKPKALRRELDQLREELKTRSVPKERLSGATITLSNFGTIAGRYASPVVSPPQVAIVGAGRSREAVIAHKGKMKIRKILPLSLSFDHRALTGGEAARFLKALIVDLESKD